MKRILFLIIFIVSCKTTTKYIYITKPQTIPPEPHYLNQMNSVKDLLTEYRRAVMKISEWQIWYDIQVETNHFQYKPTNTADTNSLEIKNILENETNF